MSDSPNIIPVSSVLKTKASKCLEESVKKDLEQDDPDTQKAKARFEKILDDAVTDYKE